MDWKILIDVIINEETIPNKWIEGIIIFKF